MRTQSSVAVCDSRGRWFLINASPDLRTQIEAYPDLQPGCHSTRNSPLAGVLLTNADLDHVLGLFCLREGGPIQIFAPRGTQASLDEKLHLTAILDSFCGTAWHQPPADEFQPLCPKDSGRGSLYFRSIATGAKPKSDAKGRDGVAYQLMDPQSGGRLLVAPNVAAVTDELCQALEASEAILFDGTFWSSNELGRVKPEAPPAEAMGHVPIRDGSLPLLARRLASLKVYIHINNTNPILTSGSPERAAVEKAGISIGLDGFTFDL